MKVITLNMNHRINEKRIPPSMPEAILSLNPDVVVLTEYVPGESRNIFLADLSAGGLVHQRMSDWSSKNNHVLIASRYLINTGDIYPEPIHESIPSNFIHITLPTEGIEVIGLRVPDYSNMPKIKREYWDWILEMANSTRDRPIIMLGDFNTDPSYPKARCGDRIQTLCGLGWHDASPTKGYSYWTPKGHGVKIDHAFLTGALKLTSSRYIKANDKHFFVGNHPEALSDHAILEVVFSNSKTIPS